MEWEERSEEIDVPPNTGVDGFVHTLREILKLPRVQEIKILKGKVSYRQYVHKGRPAKNVGLEFGSLSPYGVVRNSEMVELVAEPGTNAASVVCYMLDSAASEQLTPIAFVTGANTSIPGWYERTTGIRLRSGKYLAGLPIMTDRHLPDTALILCAGLGKDAALVDTQKAYKIEMEAAAPPDTTVEVING